MVSGEGYKESLAQEKHIYQDNANVHNLPEIFHYWSNRHIRPKLLPFGFDSPNAMFRKFLECRCAETPSPRFVSIGSGNCDLEIDLARSLAGFGWDGFVIDCVDINPEMLERGRIAARQSGVAERLNIVESDFNSWAPTDSYDAVLANQSLHHVTNLEGLFDQIKRSLRPGGVFLISDMIGRNGHQRWPEALDVIHEFWRELPPSYRFNRELNRYEELYRSFDCSCEGFEGVRSQEILPLLIDRFHFHIFIPFGNIIDPFVDRSFGPNFDANSEWDCSFIDRVHCRDEEEQAAGRLTPTHLLAVLQNEPTCEPCSPSPQSCVRAPGEAPQLRTGSDQNYNWPPGSSRELEFAFRELARLQQEFEERTGWALKLERELQETKAQLDDARATYLHNPIKYALRLIRGCWRRLF